MSLGTFLGRSPTNTVANCDLDALALAIGSADGEAANALVLAASAVATANSASAIASIAQTTANTGVTLGNTALANAATAQARADAAYALAAAIPTPSESFQVFNPRKYGALGNGTHDDTSAIVACIAAAAVNGGLFHLPVGQFKITANIGLPRNVHAFGCGSGISLLVSASDFALKVTGTFGNDAHIIEKIGFNGVHVSYGLTNADSGRGCQLVGCEIANVATCVYYGYGCYLNDIVRCSLHDCTTGILYDLATAGSGAGASQNVAFTKIFTAVNAVVVNGNTADGHHITLTGCDLEHTTNAALKTIATSEGVIQLRDCSFELNTGYDIDNDGGQIWIDGFWCISASEIAIIKQSAGFVHIARGRLAWEADKFCEITGGTIFVDAPSIFSPARWFGESVVMVPAGGSTPGFGASLSMCTAGSSGGKVVLGGVATLRTQTGVALSAVTNASKGPVTAGLWYRFDGNNRVWDFAVETTFIGTDHLMRCDISDGATTCRLDVSLPLFVGGGRFKITYMLGVGGATGTYTITGLYVETASGKATRVHQATTVDAGMLGRNRTLNFTTEKFGATASTFTVDQLDEIVSGPSFVGM